jgi:hypothetical protein
LNVYYKNARIKQYHKERRALRTETTINNTYDFGIGKRLRNLPKLRAIGFAANRRLLEVERLSHDAYSPKIPSRASTIRSQRPANAPQACALPILWYTRSCMLLSCFGSLQTAFVALICVAILPLCPAAIHNRYRKVQSPINCAVCACMDSWRLPNTFRYRVTEFGFRASLFLTRAYNRLPRIGGCNSGPAQRDQLSQSRLRKNQPRDRRIYPTSCIRPIQNLTHLAHVSGLKQS